jgi:type I restriction enzyme S subunit
LLKEKRQAVISHTVTRRLASTVPIKRDDIEWIDYIPKHWLTMPLRWLITDGLVNGIFKKREAFGSGTLLVNVSNLYNDDFRVDYGHLERVSCEEHEIKSYKVSAGDLLFVRSSLKPDGIAAVAIATDYVEPVVFECHVIRARPKRNMLDARYGSTF